ncbi:MAG: FAD-dependent oxidoreductase [Pseudomonadota bacterium]
MERVDFAVIGGGMAGATAAYELAAHGSVALLERETQTGYHASGRSAAIFIEGYGAPVWRALNGASRAFFDAPPEDHWPDPLLAARGVLEVGTAEDADAVRAEYERIAARGIDIEWVDADGIAERAPSLRADTYVCGYFEPGASDIDVDRVLQGFIRGARARGCMIITGATVTRINHDGAWRIDTPGGTVIAGAVVNAAGAWADELAASSGLARRGLQPKRRTAIAFTPTPPTATPQNGAGTSGSGPDDAHAPVALDDMDDWCMVGDWRETFYYRPLARGQLMASLADETDTPPCDAQPEELDVATLVDTLQRRTRLDIRRPDSAWAGLRTFAPDRNPVIGPDPDDETFLWLAGQGGTGIVGAPAAARLLAALATGASLPSDLTDIELSAITPARLDPLP